MACPQYLEGSLHYIDLTFERLTIPLPVSHGLYELCCCLTDCHVARGLVHFATSEPQQRAVETERKRHEM